MKKYSFLMLAAAVCLLVSAACAAPAVTDGQTTGWIAENGYLCIQSGEESYRQIPLVMEDLIQATENGIICQTKDQGVVVVNKDGAMYRKAEGTEAAAPGAVQMKLENGILTVDGTAVSVTAGAMVSDGTYQVEKSGKTGAEMLVLSASNLNREINARSFPQADERSSFAYYRHLRGRSDYSMANARRMEAAALQDDPLYQKAMGEVEAVLETIGDPFEVAALYLIDDAAYGNVDGIVHDAEHRALCVDCRRLVNGAPAACDVSGAARKDPKSYAIPWPVESLRLVVDEEGIVSLNWKNMVTVLETVSPVTNLLPFEQAAAVAEKMLPILYNPTGWEDLKSLEINITHVGLELIRIREQNNTSELKGLLVPAWVFYGTIRMTEASGFQDYANYGLKSGYDHYRGEEILLCLNAVDGSVIDPLLGY